VKVVRLLAVALLLLVSGCRLDVAVGVDVAADGSGRIRVEVTADAELVKAAGADTTLVDDLRKAGWTVDGPTAKPGGAMAVVATKRFADPAGAKQAFSELGGPFTDLTISRERTLFTTTTSFHGKVDFRRGLDSFGDEGVGDALGSPAGVDTADIEKAVNGPIDKAFGVTVVVRLPGSITESNAPAVAGNGATWRLKLSDTADLDAQSSKRNTTNIAGVAVAVLAALGLGAYGAAALRRRGRDEE
jgi:hypothetical protein